MARIELTGIQKRWGAIWGVRDVNIDIADEEFIVFLGPSGCGKTTTMRMIAGLEDPSEGEIRMDGELMNGIDARDRDVAMVFQGYALYPNMSIYENIRFPLRMRGVDKAEHDTLVRRAADLVELSDYLDRKPGALSGGQRQRAALARAIVRQPQVFLMDEPLSNLDAKLRQAMRVQIKHIQRQLRITTVYVTHDQIEAMTLADRIVIMQAGLIQQIGTPDEIYNDPANTFVAGFIGSPPMNLVEGDLQDGRFTAPGIDIAGLTLPRNGKVTLGIRPEDCTVGGHSTQLKGDVYGVEPTGDITYLTIKAGEKLIEVKADRSYRSELGVPETVAFDPARIYLFDSETGQRLR
ncbi:multiple sugar transport system ATP-binding protein [Hoeflea marina]|uniref:Multiple sugar transport system ATP-binding protein n=1 Tax=Hoeflea marina TaxID=274592 RepID=A0A317PCC5_9HYPH|nr:ABC transporter ATP-binding protein [Hoeflea marina]PWV95804.1 multiple sugar transport system ATP-binding protein [Hoeflea marina]